jgi:hypothetical protein
LLFDGPAAEGVAYELRNDDDDIILALAWYETYRSATGSEAVRIPIYGPAGSDRTYALTFWAGDVTYELYLGDLGDGTLLNGGSGAGRTDEVFRFVIDGESPFPTSAPSSSVSRSSPTDPPPVAEGPASPGDDNYERPTTIDYTPTTADDVDDSIVAAANPDTSMTPNSGAIPCGCRHVVSVAVALGFSMSFMILQ